MTKIYTVEIEGWGTLGVFSDYEAAEDYFDDLRFDPSLDLKSGQIQEFEVGQRDPQGFMLVRRADVAAGRESFALINLQGCLNAWLPERAVKSVSQL